MAKKISTNVGSIEEIRRALRTTDIQIAKLQAFQADIKTSLDSLLPAPVEVSGGIASDKATFTNLIVTDRKGNWQRFGPPANGEYVVGDLNTDVGIKWVQLDADAVYFEVYMRATTGMVYADLYDETSAATVSNSQVSTTSSSLVLVRSAALTLTLNRTYRMRFGIESGDQGEGLGGVALGI